MWTYLSDFPGTFEFSVRTLWLWCHHCRVLLCARLVFIFAYALWKCGRVSIHTVTNRREIKWAKAAQQQQAPWLQYPLMSTGEKDEFQNGLLVLFCHNKYIVLCIYNFNLIKNHMHLMDNLMYWEAKKETEGKWGDESETGKDKAQEEVQNEGLSNKC